MNDKQCIGVIIVISLIIIIGIVLCVWKWLDIGEDK